MYHVQTGAFSNPQNAENQKEALKKQGYNDAFVVKK
ncbi:MAG: SPOR domain-containing protein [Aerococcus sp.]|nr:SPOR domain-containing protein [Aerococcus sp.]